MKKGMFCYVLRDDPEGKGKSTTIAEGRISNMTDESSHVEIYVPEGESPPEFLEGDTVVTK